MNVEGAWQEGVTGKGVAVTILDDGKIFFILKMTRLIFLRNWSKRSLYMSRLH